MPSKYVEVDEKDLEELLDCVDLLMVVAKAYEKNLYDHVLPVTQKFRSHLENEKTGDGSGVALEIESVLSFMSSEDE